MKAYFVGGSNDGKEISIKSPPMPVFILPVQNEVKTADVKNANDIAKCTTHQERYRLILRTLSSDGETEKAVYAEDAVESYTQYPDGSIVREDDINTDCAIETVRIVR